MVLHLKPSPSDSADRGCSIIRVRLGVKKLRHRNFCVDTVLFRESVTIYFVQAGYGNDYLPWLYTQPLQPKGGC